MRHWENLDAIEREPSKMSGAWVFRKTRVPVSALFENLRDGATVEDFLEWFLKRLNTPDLSPGYIFITAFNSTRRIRDKFQKPAESLVKNLDLIGVDALNEAGYVQKAFPVALLTIMQDVTKSDSSLREGYLIDEVLERYQAALLLRQEELKSFVNSNPITQACMDVSLAEEIKNFRDFWANRDSLIASARQ
jgi:uncharacterized protein (DUF433 family)